MLATILVLVKNKDTALISDAERTLKIDFTLWAELSLSYNLLGDTAV